MRTNRPFAILAHTKVKSRESWGTLAKDYFLSITKGRESWGTLTKEYFLSITKNRQSWRTPEVGYFLQWKGRA